MPTLKCIICIRQHRGYNSGNPLQLHIAVSMANDAFTITQGLAVCIKHIELVSGCYAGFDMPWERK
jgi:hypothetical protein